MTRKTLKDIASEFDDIKKELQAIKDLKATLEDIIEKYKNQEKNAKENLISNASVYLDVTFVMKIFQLMMI